MSAIILHRTDPPKNMRWFYMLDVQRRARLESDAGV
jgi:predicted DNA-binding WGR domain protein